MFGVGVGATRFAQPKMIARQHGAWMGRVFGACVGAPGSIAVFGVEPTHQIPYRAAHGMRAGNGIERNQVQPSDAGLPCRRLRLYLNQFIVTGETKGSSRDRMLSRRGNRRSTPLRSGSGRTTRVTAQETTAQRSQLEEARRWFHGQP
jgi:hypothetical protein